MFANKIVTSIDIKVSAEKAFAELSHFEQHSTWNPMLKNIQGSAKLGTTIKFDVPINENKNLSLKAKIIDFKSGQILTWQGGSILTVRGTHFFNCNR